ncbi:MAG: HNH endonuclease signature motif containing protein [Actinomycetaceae bacterium]
MSTDEEWRRVADLPYSVSSLGRLSSDRYGRILEPTVRPTGYAQATLAHRRSVTYRLVHRLVLEAFIGPCPEGMEACHNNGNRTDNRLENLRWDTRLANAHDAIRHGTHPGAASHCPRGHELTAPNLTRSGVRKGRRRCLACSRGLSFVWNHRDRYDETFTEEQIQSICDGYHLELSMTGAAA